MKRIADRPNHEIDESAVDYGAPLEASLRERGLIDPGFDEKTGKYVCRVTSLGLSAIEEYEQNQRQQKREAEALALSREDAALSKEANALSKEANGLSQRANRIALLALALSLLGFAVSLVALFK